MMVRRCSEWEKPVDPADRASVRPLRAAPAGPQPKADTQNSAPPVSPSAKTGKGMRKAKMAVAPGQDSRSGGVQDSGSPSEALAHHIHEPLVQAESNHPAHHSNIIESIEVAAEQQVDDEEVIFMEEQMKTEPP